MNLSINKLRIILDRLGNRPISRHVTNLETLSLSSLRLLSALRRLDSIAHQVHVLNQTEKSLEDKPTDNPTDKPTDKPTTKQPTE